MAQKNKSIYFGQRRSQNASIFIFNNVQYDTYNTHHGHDYIATAIAIMVAIIYTHTYTHT